MPNPQNLKPFQKGTSGNPKGRPKSFKQLRALVVSIASEVVDKEQTITRIENMIREMLKSDNPADRALALKYGWGNVPEQTDITSGGEKITVRLITDD